MKGTDVDPKEVDVDCEITVTTEKEISLQNSGNQSKTGYIFVQ